MKDTNFREEFYVAAQSNVRVCKYKERRAVLFMNVPLLKVHFALELAEHSTMLCNH